MHLPDAEAVVAEARAARAAIGPDCTDDDIMDACGAYIRLFDVAKTFPKFQLPDIEWLARFAISRRTRKPN